MVLGNSIRLLTLSSESDGKMPLESHHFSPWNQLEHERRNEASFTIGSKQREAHYYRILMDIGSRLFGFRAIFVALAMATSVFKTAILSSQFLYLFLDQALPVLQQEIWQMAQSESMSSAQLILLNVWSLQIKARRCMNMLPILTAQKSCQNTILTVRARIIIIIIIIIIIQ